MFESFDMAVDIGVLKDALHIVSVVPFHYLGYHDDLFLRFFQALKMMEQKKI